MTARRIALGSFAAAVVAPVAMLAYQLALSRGWVPDRPGESIEFLNYRMPHPSAWVHALFLLDVVFGFAFVVAVVLAPQLREVLGRRFLAVVIAAQAFGLAVMVASPFPMDSDQYAYVYYAQLTQDRVNPYPQYTRPLVLGGVQERRIAVHWDNPPYVDRYGPAWTVGNAALLSPLRGHSAEFLAKVLRIVASIAALACTLLLAAILRGRRADVAVLAFALNPLVLVACGNGGHNDIYLVFFGLLAWWLAQRDWFELSAAALATAVCVKFAYAPLLPALLAWTWFRSKSLLRAALAAAAFAGATVIFSLPLGIRTSLGDPVFTFNSTHESRISYYVWRIVAHVPGLHNIPGGPFAELVPLLTVATALGIAWYALRGRRISSLEFFMALCIMLLPYKIESWYGVMLTPLLLVPGRYAVPAFLAETLACEFLQMRIFYASSEPYTMFSGIVAVIGLLLVEFWPRQGTQLQWDST